MSGGLKRRSWKRRRTGVTNEGRHCLSHSDSSDDFVDDEQQSFYIPQDGSATKNTGKANLYKDSYLSMGFTWTGDPSCPFPLCIMCHKKFSNSSMVPSKLERHLKTRHSYVASKDAAYFKKLLESQNKQSQSFVKKFSFNEKAREASYLISELIAQRRESYTVGENLIMPACKIIVSKVIGQDALREIENVSLSCSTISRRIEDMSHDAEKVLCEILKDSSFALKVHMSRCFVNKSHVITFVRFVNEGEIQENFLCYKELPETSRMKDVFNALSSHMTTKGLSWKNCVGFSIYSAPSVIDSTRNFASLVKQANPNIKTQCFLHRELLILKTLVNEMRKVLDDVTNMVNFIKKNPAQSRMFKKLCESLDGEYINILLHTETRWLNRGTVLDKLYQLQGDLAKYFQENSRPDFAECFQDEEWLLKLTYLADILHHIHQLNESLRDPGENILATSDRILGFKRKLDIWKRHIAKKNLDMFPQLLEVVSEESYQQISRLIVNHLEELRNRIEYYFPSISTRMYDWVRNPFSESASESRNLTLREEEELCELQSDRTLKMRFTDLSLDKFWISLREKYPAIHMKAVNIMLQPSSPDTCEQAFSCLANIMGTDRKSLVSVEEEIRLCLSKVRPRIECLSKR